jgi:precorrin-6B methylase 2
LELVEAARLTEADIFFDEGSGLGQVAILVHLLRGSAAKGIEIEPAYCGYARACAAELGLSRVEFLEADAREADYSAGTVFFMYTPCEGKMLEDALARLRSQAGKGARLFTYGPCTAEVARLGWHRLDPRSGVGENVLGEFLIV